MIEVKDLTKNYGPVKAVCGVSFTIEKGRVYGLLGVNGAGKSTVMNIMTGCLSPTSGTVTVDGHDIYEDAIEAKKKIGYLPEVPPLYPDMTPREYLRFIAKAKKIKTNRKAEIERVSRICGIADVSDRLIKTLSKGYRQRVGIAGALVGDPEVIILDEPTVGLDPIQLIEIRTLISSLREDHAIVISSHVMSEIAAVCDRIIIMAYGKVVAEGSLDELEESRRGRTVTVTSTGKYNDYKKIKEILSAVEGVDYVLTYPRGAKVRSVVETKEGCDAAESVKEALVSHGEEVTETVTAKVSLEDIFIRLTTVAAEERAREEAEDGEVPLPGISEGGDEK